MLRLILVAALWISTTTEAQAPSIDQLFGAYISMPWSIAEEANGAMLACVPVPQSRIIDYIVAQLAIAARAKVSCS